MHLHVFPNFPFQNCMFRELFVPTLLSQVRFNPKTKLTKRHINVGRCSSLEKKNFHHFSDWVTVAWRHQTMTSHFSLHTASFKHHCKIRKCLLCTLYKFYIIPSYIQRDMRVVSELFDPPTYIGWFVLFAEVVATLSASEVLNINIFSSEIQTNGEKEQRKCFSLWCLRCQA